MIDLKRIDRLTRMQRKELHEAVGKYIKENCEVVATALLPEAVRYYCEEAEKLQKDLLGRQMPDNLNGILCEIYQTALTQDDETCRGLAEYIIQRYQQMKHVDKCFALMNSLKDADVTIDEFTELANVSMHLYCEGDEPYVDYKLPLTRESWHLIKNLASLHITICGAKYTAEAGDFHIESNKNGENGSVFEGRIKLNRLTGDGFGDDTPVYYRYMIPVNTVEWYRDIRTYAAFIQNSCTLGLVEVKYSDTLLHIYPGKDNGRNYMVVESLSETSGKKMAEYVYSAALTLGFITGKIHLGRCYEFSSDEPEFDGHPAMAYHTMRPSSDTNELIFTTNMYYVNDMLKHNAKQVTDKRPLYDDAGEFKPYLQDWLRQDFIQSLFALIQSDPKIARAVVTIVESANFPLEYQAGVRAIVLETLAHSVSGPKPIPDNNLWKKMAADIQAVIDRYKHDENGEQQISDESYIILGKKVASMNNPTNADSLARPLQEAGYVLTDNDNESLKMRNTFLHGGLTKGTVEKQTDEIFYLSLMMHKMACIIILKKAGFGGYVLNNPLLFGCKKAVEAGEPPLLKI